MFIIQARDAEWHKDAWDANREKYWRKGIDKTGLSVWDFYNDDNEFTFTRREGYVGAIYEFKSEADYLMFLLKRKQ